MQYQSTCRLLSLRVPSTARVNDVESPMQVLVSMLLVALLVVSVVQSKLMSGMSSLQPKGTSGRSLEDDQSLAAARANEEGAPFHVPLATPSTAPTFSLSCDADGAFQIRTYGGCDIAHSFVAVADRVMFHLAPWRMWSRTRLPSSSVKVLHRFVQSKLAPETS